MSNDDNTELWGSVILLVICLIIWMIVAPITCNSKWSKSGFETDWGPIQGCLISQDGKKWIPEENYREIP